MAVRRMFATTSPVVVSTVFWTAHHGRRESFCHFAISTQTDRMVPPLMVSEITGFVVIPGEFPETRRTGSQRLRTVAPHSRERA
jgi:hypothetical protein